MDVSAENLFRLIRQGRDKAARRYKASRTAIEYAATRGFYGGVAEKDLPENYFFTWYAHTVARLMSGFPDLKLTDPRRENTIRVLELEAGGNKWMYDTRYEVERERFAADFCFGTAVAVVRNEPRAGFEQWDDPLKTPKAVRIAPHQFGWDHEAGSVEESRILFHVQVAPKDQLLKRSEDDGWLLDVIRGLPEEQGTAEARGNDSERMGGVNRGEVAFFEAWVPEYTVEDGDPVWEGLDRAQCHGTLFTLAWGGAGAEHGEAVFIRKPRPFRGPRRGPYVVEGFFVLPDEVARLSPLIANQSQLLALNRQAIANDKSSEARKKIAMLDGLTPESNAQIMSAVDGDVIVVPGLDATKVVEVEVGGPSPEMRVREIDLRERVERNLMFSQAFQGSVSGSGTATENAIAAGAAGNIVGHLERKFARFEEELMLRVLWYLNADANTVTASGGEIFFGGPPEDVQNTVSAAARQGMIGPDEAQALGMMEQQADTVSVDDLEIRVLSTKIGADEEQRLMQASNFLAQWLPMAPMVASYADLGPLWERAAKVFKMPEIVRIVDSEAAQEFFQQQQAAAAQGAGGAAEMSPSVAMNPSPARSASGGGMGGGRPMSGNGRSGESMMPPVSRNRAQSVKEA